MCKSTSCKAVYTDLLLRYASWVLHRLLELRSYLTCRSMILSSVLRKNEERLIGLLSFAVECIGFPAFWINITVIFFQQIGTYLNLMHLKKITQSQRIITVCTFRRQGSKCSKCKSEWEHVSFVPYLWMLLELSGFLQPEKWVSIKSSSVSRLELRRYLLQGCHRITLILAL